MSSNDGPVDKLNWGRIIQGFLFAVLLGVFAVPLIWFGGRAGRADRMTGAAVGVMVSYVLILAYVVSR